MAERTGRATALVISITLHALVVGASLVSWPWKKEVKPLTVTPVTLMTSAQLAALTAADQSPDPAPAQTPEPDPVAEPAPIVETPTPEPAAAPTPAPKPAPQPAPRPAPLKPAPPKPAPPRPAPSPTPLKPAARAAPTPARPAQTRPAAAAPTPVKPAPRMSLDDLAASLAQGAPKAGGAPRSGGARGLSQLEKDLQARKAEGAAKAATADGLGLVTAKLIRLWNPNCEIAAAQGLQVRVRIFLQKDGSLARAAQLADYPSPEAIADPVLKAAASRALSAVGRGAPYEGLPADNYDGWKQFIARFDGKLACNR